MSGCPIFLSCEAKIPPSQISSDIIIKRFFYFGSPFKEEPSHLFPLMENMAYDEMLPLILARNIEDL